MDYAKLARDLVANAINNQLGPVGTTAAPGLVTEVVIHHFVEQGEYDAVTGQYANVYENTPPITVVAARPSMDEVTSLGVTGKDFKLLIPGKSVSRELTPDDAVTLGGKRYTAYKTKGVPSDAVYIVFVRLT